MNQLTVFDKRVEKHLAAYRAMGVAIAHCRTIDECKDVVDKSVALAAYYRQIKDDEAVRNFQEVKLRAWRQIAKLIGGVDVSDCPTQVTKAQKIRQSFTDDAMKTIPDARITELLRLAQVPDDDFEKTVGFGFNSVDAILRNTPEANRERCLEGY